MPALTWPLFMLLVSLSILIRFTPHEQGDAFSTCTIPVGEEQCPKHVEQENGDFEGMDLGNLECPEQCPKQVAQENGDFEGMDLDFEKGLDDNSTLVEVADKEWDDGTSSSFMSPALVVEELVDSDLENIDNALKLESDLGPRTGLGTGAEHSCQSWNRTWGQELVDSASEKIEHVLKKGEVDGGARVLDGPVGGVATLAAQHTHAPLPAAGGLEGCVQYGSAGAGPSEAAYALQTGEGDFATAPSQAAPWPQGSEELSQGEYGLPDGKAPFCGRHDFELPGAVDLDFAVLREAMEKRSQQSFDTGSPLSGEAKQGEQASGLAGTPSTTHSGVGGLYDLMFDDDGDGAAKPIRSGAVHLNLTLLVALLEGAEPTLQYVEGKDVVMLLGTTGVGKSTLIQALDGRRLRRVRYTRTSDGESPSLERDVWVADSELEGFAIGHDQVSKTKGISHYAKGDVVYVDSSGFEDTTGVEVDIATTLSFMRVAKGCRRLRFVVMISCAAFLQDRGGSMRSLVTLVRSMVDDFKGAKFAFSFIFTHTDVLPEASAKNLSEIKVMLRGYLFEVQHGTRDKQVRSILSWMVGCLVKKIPFVDVFHPALSDIGDLQMGFEKFEPEKSPNGEMAYPAIGLAPGELPVNVIRCGLTAKAISKIKNELDRLRMDGNRMLTNSLFGELANVRRSVGYLMTHMPEIEEVANAFKQVMDMIQEHRKALSESTIRLIEAGIERGPQPFGTEKARHALEQLAALDALEAFEMSDSDTRSRTAQVNVNFLHRELTHMVLELQKHFCDDRSQMPPLGSATAMLQKLRAWAEAHVAFHPHARAGSQVLERYVSSSIWNARNSPDIVSMIQPLAHLQHIYKSHPDLAELGIRNHDVGVLRDDISDKVKGAIHESSERALSALDPAASEDDQSRDQSPKKLELEELTYRLCIFQNSTESLERTCAALDSEERLSDLKAICDHASQSVLGAAESELQRRSSAAMDSARADQKSQSETSPLSTQVQTLALVVKALSPTQSSKSNAHAQYKAVIDVAMQSVQIWCNELEHLLNQLTQSGMGDVQRHMWLLGSLDASRWLDSCAPSHAYTVAARALAFKERYLAQFVAASKNVLGLLRVFMDPVGQGDAPSVQLKVLQRVLALIDSFEELGEVYPELIEARRYLDQALADLVRTWIADQRGVVDACPASLDLLDGSCAKDVDHLLVVCGHLREVVPFQGLLEELAKEIEAKLASLRVDFERLLAEQEHYPEKAHAMRVVSSWHQQKLVSITQALPSLDECANQFRHDITAHAAKVRDVIHESADCARAEPLLQELENAYILDEWLDKNWVRYQIDTLRSVLDLKERSLSEALQAQIQECSFQGIHEHLEPLKGNQQRLQEIWTAISDSVHRQIALAEMSVTTGKNLTGVVRKLQDADEQIGTELKERKSVNIPAVVDKIKLRVNTAFGDLISELESAVKTADFAAIIQKQRIARTYHSRTKTLMDRKQEGQAVRAFSKAGECLERVQELVDGVVAKFTEVWKVSNVDTSSLYADLGKLRRIASDTNYVEDDPPISFEEDKEEFEQRWLVVGGKPGYISRSAGIPVHDDEDEAKSKALSEKLSHGAVIRELDRNKNRVRNALVSGSGPRTGWVSIHSGSRWHGAYLEEESSTRGVLPPGMTAHKARLFYEDVSHRLMGSTTKLCNTLDEMENDRHHASSIVDVLIMMERELDRGLSEHVGGRLGVDKRLEQGRRQAEETAKELHSMLGTPESITRNIVPMLDELHRRARKDSWGSYLNIWGWAASRQYNVWVQQLTAIALELSRTARTSLDQHVYEQAGYSALFLVHIWTESNRHIQDGRVLTEVGALRSHVKECLVRLQTDLAVALKKDNILEFEMLFLRYHKFVQGMTQAYPDLDLVPLHESMFRCTEAKAAEARRQLDRFDFAAAEKSIVLLRDLGRVLTGIFAVYCEGVRSSDPWLHDLRALCSEHFGGKALADLGPLYALLGIMPNASPEEINQAFRRKSKEFHPDKHQGQGVTRLNTVEMQQKIVNARDTLMNDHVRKQYTRGLTEPFSKLIEEVPPKLCAAVQDALTNQNYTQAGNVLTVLKDLPALTDLVEPKLDTDGVCVKIHGVVKAHVDQACARIKNHWTARELKKLNEAMMSLEEIDNCFSGYPQIYNTSWYSDIREEVEREVDKLGDTARELMQKDSFEDAPQDFALQLIYLGRIFDDLPRFRNHAKMKICDLLDECQDQGDVATLFKLGMILEQGRVGWQDSQGNVIDSDQRVGKIIVKEFRHFKDVLTFVWNEQTSATQKDIDATLREIAIKRVVGPSVTPLPVELQRLRQGFDEYTRAYDKLFHLWRADELKMDTLVKDTVAQAKTLQPCRIDPWSPGIKQALPELLAGIAAYFTVSRSGDSYKALLNAGSGHGQQIKLSTGGTSRDRNSSSAGSTVVKTDNVLQKPHGIQILTILRLFGYDDSSDGHKLRSQLMHIQTGEGKSMILGMSSLLFGLLGFRVRSICYSEYLSLRDYKLFEDMFTQFGVSGLVTYSRITTFSEDQIAAKGNIGDLTRTLLSGPATSTFSAPTGPPGTAANDEILLVDEVDMFFGKYFYGQTHNLIVLIDAPEVSAILREIWGYRHNSGSPRSILESVKQTSRHYSALLQKFPGWEFMIDREVSAMCHDLPDFEMPPYHVSRATDSIGYKDMDGISYNKVYGYRTAFAYLNEESNFKDPAKALGEALRLKVPCGHFSYANINFSTILGVSGTVAALGEHEWQIMNKYGIDIYTNMPSVYGFSNFKFLDQQGIDPIKVTKTRDEQFMAVTDIVNALLKEKRAAIVIFENPSVLEEYEKSPYHGRVQRKNALTERLSHEDKEFIIKKAATSGQATFTSAIFGRGTDFFCNDEKLQKAGGVHVIQAFFSLDKSEEVQIQGRTARQGQKGTFSMVLLEEDVHQKLDSKASLHMPAPDLYKFLEDERRKRQSKTYEDLGKDLQAADERDALTHKYFDALLAHDMQGAKSLFKDLYEMSR